MAVNFVERIDDAVPVRNILVSVSDKTGLDTFIPGILGLCVDARIYSTGGTFKFIADVLGHESAARQLAQISDYTGQPEMQGGLVKTLDFKIYLGLLGETYNEAHIADLMRVGAMSIDMVVVNLYPFAQTVARPETTPEIARANIDIGGPCMARAAAKNFLRVASVTDPADYGGILSELKRTNGSLSLQTRFNLAQKAFAHTAAYDAAIASYLNKQTPNSVRACYRIEKVQ